MLITLNMGYVHVERPIQCATLYCTSENSLIAWKKQLLRIDMKKNWYIQWWLPKKVSRFSTHILSLLLSLLFLFTIRDPNSCSTPDPDPSNLDINTPSCISTDLESHFTKGSVLYREDGYQKRAHHGQVSIRDCWPWQRTTLTQFFAGREYNDVTAE